MAKQVSRDSKVPLESLLKPFDVTKFGTEDDPCFGKHHDLNADECQICGDIEICSIATMQNRLSMRKLLENETKYKDLEEAELIRNKQIKDFVEKLRSKNLPTSVIRVRLKTRFGLTHTKTKQWI